ncbi:hypothetical protein [Burkholderia sp. GS2Y]|uniref:MazG C-terminal domain-containing protein n=1 Tax=Burkholderia theae TaxID=3143496 RepID=A0ABU9WBA6_9BURK
MRKKGGTSRHGVYGEAHASDCLGKAGRRIGRFHLAYVAHLGWSPVIRALLKLKRKSDPKLDENEDGARAAIIEEGIATWIFNHADHHDFYENMSGAPCRPDRAVKKIDDPSKDSANRHADLENLSLKFLMRMPILQLTFFSS